jgi:predicted PurR-regulated permease PerM
MSRALAWLILPFAIPLLMAGAVVFCFAGLIDRVESRRHRKARISVILKPKE